MTSRELLRLVLRRWYLVLLGALVSAVMLGVIWKQPGLYWTQFDVVVLAPTTKLNPNNIEDPRFSMAPMAGVMVTELNGDKRPRLLASADTTLFGEGLREGVRVRLPNTGSQWLPMYNRPRIDVQVVSRDPVVVERKARAITEQLVAVLDRRQSELGIIPSMRMSAIATPEDPVVAHITGNRNRAALGMAMLGATLTTFAVYLWEKWRLGRRRRPRRAEGGGPTSEPRTRPAVLERLP